MMILKDWLAEHFLEDVGLHPCAQCSRLVESVCLGRELEEAPWRCQTCLIDAHRATTAEVEAAQVVDALSWSSEHGRALKAERNRLLDQYRWTIMPDSPLTLDAQAHWLAYLKKLQNMTRVEDHPTTTTWTWPEKPAYSYPPIVLTPNSVTINLTTPSLKPGLK